MKKTFYTLLLIGATLFTACDKCGGDYNFVSDNYLLFHLFDRNSKEELLGFFGKYNSDTVKIFDESGKSILQEPVDTDGSVSLYFLNFDDYKNPIGTKITKQFYLYLEDEDTDTIRIEFVQINDKCGAPRLENLQVIYNDSLYTIIPSSRYIDFYK